MSTAQPDLVARRRIIFADAAPATQDLLSRCLASMDATGVRGDSVAAVPDLRDALAADPELSGVVLIAPVEALLEGVSQGLDLQQALKRVRPTLNALMYCLRQYHQRLVVIDLSHAATAPDALAEALALPGGALDGFSLGDADPVLRALAAQALADDAACRLAFEFLEASSVVPPDAASPAPVERAIGAYLSVRQGASEAAALRAEVARRDATAKLADRQIAAMTEEFGKLGSMLQAAEARAEETEEQVSALRGQLEESEARVADGAGREAELSRKLEVLEARIQRLRASWTFRATKPIRRLAKSLRKKRHG